MIDVRNRLLLSLCLLMFLVPAAGAQTVTYEDQVNLYHPTATGELGLFTALAGETLRQGDWSFSLYWNEYDYLAADPLPSMRIPSRRSFREMDVDESRITASIGYGLTDRWEIAAMLPYSRIESNAGDLSGFINGYPYAGEFDDSGLGNLHIGTKFALTDPNTTDSRLALSLFADLPTGDEDSGIASGSTDYGVGLHWNRGIWVAGGQYKIRGDRDASDNPMGFDVSLSDEVRIDIGTNIPLNFMGTTNWINELNAIVYTGGDDIGQPDEIVYLVTGLRHWFGNSGWALNAGLRGNVTMATSDNNSCPIGGLLGLSYAAMHLTPPPPPPAIIVPPPPPAPVTPPAEPVTPPREPVELRVDEIHFEPASARVTNIAKAILDDVALRMKQEPASTAIVIGYTDNREDTGTRNDLDRRRAEAVRDYLVSRHGIDPSRISVEGGGVSTVGDNSTAEGRLQNRRVVIRLIVP